MQLLLPLHGFQALHLHHLIQPLLLCIQFFLNQLLLQNLGIPDGMALSIEDDLGSRNEVVVLGLGVRMVGEMHHGDVEVGAGRNGSRILLSVLTSPEKQ